MKPFYSRGGITIYCGDCLEVMPLLVDEGAVFDAIIADLPYGKTELSWDSILPLDILWDNYKRLMKPCGSVVLTATQPFASLLVTSNVEWFRYEDIWHKTQSTGHVNAYKLPLREHENILIFSLKSRVFNPQFQPKPVENVRPITDRTPSKMFVRGKLKQSRKIKNNLSFPRSVIKFPNVNGNERYGHPTQKPVKLLQYLTRTYTNPGDIILDNTMGSGTTLVAAQNEGRQAVGIELSEEYCKIAVERLKQPSFFSIPDKPDKPKEKQLSLV